jgi:hypothetical protein
MFYDEVLKLNDNEMGVIASIHKYFKFDDETHVATVLQSSRPRPPSVWQ